MGAPKAASGEDKVLAAFDAAPLDQNALTSDEAADLDAQIAAAEASIAAGETPFRSSAEVRAEIAERLQRGE